MPPDPDPTAPDLSAGPPTAGLPHLAAPHAAPHTAHAPDAVAPLEGMAELAGINDDDPDMPPAARPGDVGEVGRRRRT